MIRAVIFDCFGVLYQDPGKTFYETSISNYLDFARELADIDKRSDYGFITADEHAQAVSELTGLSKEDVLVGIGSVHQLNQSLLEYAQSLRTRYKLGMLSNIGSGGMESFFSKAQQVELFDVVILSSEVGMIKPSTEIFVHTARQLDVKPNECIMIDDRAENCEGAERAGMKAVLHTSSSSTLYEIDALLRGNDA